MKYIKKKSDLQILKEFMKEQLPIKELFKVGFFTPEMKGDYPAMAERVANFFGYKTVFEYGAEEIRCHISDGNKDPKAPFLTVIKSTYE